jgi:hypothetical protein
VRDPELSGRASQGDGDDLGPASILDGAGPAGARLILKAV